MPFDGPFGCPLRYIGTRQYWSMSILGEMWNADDEDVRIPFSDSLGIIKKMGELAEKHGVSIHSILQNPIVDRLAADFVVTTKECKFSQVQSLCEDFDKQDFARSNALCMPLLMEIEHTLSHCFIKSTSLHQ